MGFLAWLPWVGYAVWEGVKFLTAERRSDVGTQRTQETKDAPARLQVGPAAHVLGRARWEGRLVYSTAPRTRVGGGSAFAANVLHRAYALSQGEIEAIEAVWVDGEKRYLTEEVDYLFRGRRDPPDGSTDGDDPQPDDPQLGDEDVLPPGVIYRIVGVENQYNSANSQWRLLDPAGGRNAPPLPDALFEDGHGANPRFARAQWRLPAGSDEATIQLAFLSDTEGGGFAGPQLKNASNYSLILRSEGTTERFPIQEGQREPYPVVATTAQAIWLSRFPRLAGQEWDLAIIDHTAWDDRLWGRWELAFENRSELNVPTGALVVAGRAGETTNFRIWPYLNPNLPPRARWGSLRRATAGLPEDRRWTINHRLDGMAGCHVEVIQPGSNDWEAPPDIQFLLKGRKIRWPGGPTENGVVVPAWTENAAAIRWWWETERRGVEPSKIDLQAFEEAYALCNELVTYQLPPKPEGRDDAFSSRSLRYSINGIAFDDDPPDNIEREFDFAWHGRMEYRNGVHKMLPGAQREAKWIIGERDLLEEPAIQLGIREEGVVTGVQVVLAQSRDHDFGEMDMTPARVYHEVGETIQLGKRAFVNDPHQAGRLGTLTLREEREKEIVSIRVAPGRGLSRQGIRIGDLLRLTAQSADESGRTYRVVQHEIDDEDESVRMALTPDIEWTDSFVAIPSRVHPPEGTPAPGTGSGVLPGEVLGETDPNAPEGTENAIP